MMPISKVGTSMGKKNSDKKVRGFVEAFTFIEVVIALAIVSISLLGLLRLHLLSISTADRAQITNRAVLVAQQKIAETLAQGYPQLGTDQGISESGTPQLHWKRRIRDVQLSQLSQAHFKGLREIRVDVGYKQGNQDKNLYLSTYIANRYLQ
jgi:type II secretion system protein I